MSRHTITHADEIFIGNAVALGVNGAKRGIEMMPIHQQVIESAPLGDVDGIATAQAVAAAGDLTLDGAFATAGVATIPTARNVAILSSNAGDTTQTATVTGTDIVGNPQVEDIAFNGTTEAVGAKAFATVTQIAVDAALAGNASAGTSVTLANVELGLDAGLESTFDVLAVTDGASPTVAEGGTFTVADQTDPATATTGDTKGTFNPANALDGVVDIVMWYHPRLVKESYGENFTG